MRGERKGEEVCQQRWWEGDGWDGMERAGPRRRNDSGKSCFFLGGKQLVRSRGSRGETEAALGATTTIAPCTIRMRHAAPSRQQALARLAVVAQGAIMAAAVVARRSERTAGHALHARSTPTNIAAF